MYKILVVDDSALMRRIICDIINADSDFRVIDVSADGEDAYNKIKNQSFDMVVLDMILPKMSGLECLEKLVSNRVPFNVILVSSSLKEDADSTIRAIELGALDFVVKPIRSTQESRTEFSRDLLNAMHNATKMRSFKTINAKSLSSSANITGDKNLSNFERNRNPKTFIDSSKGGDKSSLFSNSRVHDKADSKSSSISKDTKSYEYEGTIIDCKPARGKKIIALACSTGGPQALHTFVPMLPKNLSCPLVIVQHMPQGFTASLASRLDQISQIRVKEAEDGEFFKPGIVYITPGGKHMEICENASRECYCHLSDDPPVNSLKPCADVMYKSLTKSSFDEILCVVLTGMGADGSEGIKFLKQFKKTYVISQEASTCVVYGMPKAVEQAGLSNEIVPLKSVANSIVKKLGG